MLIAFDDIITDMEANKVLSPIVTNWVLITHMRHISHHFTILFQNVQKCKTKPDIFLFLNIPIQRELQQIASNHSSDIEFKNSMKFYKDYTEKQFSVLVNDTALPSDNPLRFTKYVR